MFDYTNQTQAVPLNRLTQNYPMTDMQSNNQFTCMQGEYGCIPTPINPANPIQNPNSNQNISIQPPVSHQIVASAYDAQYLNQFLMTQIGRQVTVEFLIGTNTFTDKSGKLLAVGTNYILLQETNSDDIVACDFYNIKFVKFYF